MKEKLDRKAILDNYQKAIIDQYDANIPFVSFKDEQNFFDHIRKGNVDYIRKASKNIGNLFTPSIGIMSKDPKDQMRFAIVSGITMATRYAMAGGLPENEALRLSDVYLQQLESIVDSNQASKLFFEAVLDFATRVNKLRQSGTYSLQVVKTIKYINTNLHNKITLEELASNSNITPQYLSYLFHKEKGMTITEYIRNIKLDIACQMLEKEDYSIERISNILSFPSQSAFTTYFKERYNMTPKKYKEANYNKIY